ncbi:hypothetical protein EA473_20505 [Natrarchaeobius chitinivorans]|uniref:Uncharacterized protein n=1 Tax=Natrarchaeobius chitinivorans TaxID=1679083 RepID=A0A3N6MYP0_NATCH|nr:hypothetical protein EA473_20505 [Natrarchaeobius chitinivorans]
MTDIEALESWIETHEQRLAALTRRIEATGDSVDRELSIDDGSRRSLGTGAKTARSSREDRSEDLIGIIVGVHSFPLKNRDAVSKARFRDLREATIIPISSLVRPRFR